MRSSKTDINKSQNFSRGKGVQSTPEREREWAHEYTDKIGTFDNKSSRGLSIGKNTNKPRSSSANLMSQIELELFDGYMENLQKIFQFYCSYGDPLNKTKMKSIKFMKILKEAGLLHVFSFSWL